MTLGDDLFSSMNRSTVWLIEVCWPFAILAGLVWMFRKSIRLPSPKQIPIVPSIIAIGAMWTLAWLTYQFGQMSSDECGSLGPEGWELIKFIAMFH